MIVHDFIEAWPCCLDSSQMTDEEIVAAVRGPYPNRERTNVTCPDCLKQRAAVTAMLKARKTRHAFAKKYSWDACGSCLLRVSDKIHRRKTLVLS